MNEAIFSAINGVAGISPVFDRLIVFFADSVLWVVIALVLLYALLRPHNRSERLAKFVFMIIGAVIAWGIASFIKDYIPVERPFLALDGVRQLIIHGDHDSFPSGHTTFLFALATMLTLHHKRWGIALFAVAALAGFARVAAGIHWPLDILAGAALGIIVGYVFHRLLSKAKG